MTQAKQAHSTSRCPGDEQMLAEGWGCRNKACLVLDEVPVEAVEFVQRHDVQKLFDEGKREKMAPAIQQHPTPQEPWRIHNLRPMQRQPCTFTRTLLQ
jgi:hypothetical protein